MKTAKEYVDDIRLRSYGTFDGETVVRKRIEEVMTTAIRDAVEAAAKKVEDECSGSDDENVIGLGSSLSKSIRSIATVR